MYEYFDFYLYMGTTYVSGARGSERRELHPFKLQMVMGHHVRAGNQTQALYKNDKCSKFLSHLPCLFDYFVSVCIYAHQ